MIAVNNEKRFFETLENIFVGAPIEGEGGYVNLLKIKEKYYRGVVAQLNEEINNDRVITNEFKNNFYDMLYNFFEKYFSECGSVYFTKTANWQRVYEKVYNDNKDVILFWKTHMLYYVKSDILFHSIYIKSYDEKENANYVFYFDVGSLKQKQNNEKKELVFSFKEVRNGKVSGVHDNISGDKTFVLTVGYSERGRKTDVDAISMETGIRNELIDKAISAFKKQNTVDFFINKNAKIFLEEQLELFLHQYLLDDTMFDQDRLNQIKAVQNYAKKLILFIAQFENELVRIWNKPKFVKNSNYVITIDRLTDALFDKVMKSNGLPDQINEWIKLGFVDEGFVLNKNTLTTNPHLPIDTKYFKETEIEILSMFDNLDESLNGRLVHSENYQALNTLQHRYHDQVKCLYIDPPFNTGKDFDYIDGYQDATWLSIMRDRLELSHGFIKDDGGAFIHLDRYANYYVRVLLNDIYGKDNYKAELYWDTCGNTGFKTSKNNWYQNTNCIIQYAKDFDKYDFNKLYTLLNVADPNKPKEERKEKGIGWLDLQIDKELETSKEKHKGYVEQYKDGNLEKKYFEFESKVDPIGMIWTDVLSFLYTQVGNNESYFFNGGQKPEHLLARIILSQTKQNELVMDYFTGIGTTVAVAHKLNRKYLGVEMGSHFNTFYDNDSRVGVIGRMKNVLNGDSTFFVLNPYKPEKSERKPQLTRQLNWQGGGFFKYYELEQYEDTLSRSVYGQENGQLYAKDVFNQYIFFADEKLADVLITMENGEFDLDFDKLYTNIDLPETLSLLYGKPIEKITADDVKLAEISKPIKYNVKNMTSDEKLAFVKVLKPLLWWGE